MLCFQILFVYASASSYTRPPNFARAKFGGRVYDDDASVKIIHLNTT